MTKNSTTVRVLGCDVSKDNVVIFDTATEATLTVDNTPKALTRALSKLGNDAFVVCEATGGHERPLLNAATIAGLSAHRGDPRKISAFLRSLRGYAKTDRIDAKGLARYGTERHDRLACWQPPSKAHENLQCLVHLRADIVQDRADFTKRLKAPGMGPDKRHIRILIENLEARIAAVEAEILELLETDEHLTRVVTLIEAIPGCGKTTAIALAAVLPELGQMTRRQAASLAGLAPHPWDSGKMQGHRHVRGGRKEAKKALFMASLSAKRHNPELAAFANRLADGKRKPIVIVIAVARKLITIINARIRDALYQPTEQLS